MVSGVTKRDRSFVTFASRHLTHLRKFRDLSSRRIPPNPELHTRSGVASARSRIGRRIMADTTTDHDTIRKWTEAHGGKPAAVDSTHKNGDVGIIRIMFPNSSQSHHENLVEISWDDFFKQFEESKLALIYEDDGRFSKIVSRDGID
jgi:hypothetical protein